MRTTLLVRASSVILLFILVTILVTPTYAFDGEAAAAKPIGGLVSILLPESDAAVLTDANGFGRFTGTDLQQIGQPGEPSIPCNSVTVLLPPDADLATVTARITNRQWTALDGKWDIPPVFPVATWDGDNTSVIAPSGRNIVDGKDLDIYNTDALFPLEPIRRVDTQDLRGWKIAQILYAPYAWNPVERRLYRLSGNAIEAAFGRKLLKNNAAGADLAGVEQIQGMTANFATAVGDYSGYAASAGPAQYVIITTSAISSASTKLADFVASKEARGFTVEIVTESTWGGGTGNTAAERLRSWLKGNYISLGIKYVLLIGNPDPSSGDVPMKMCYPQKSQPAYKECPTDFYYAELTSNDWNRDGDGQYGEYYDDFLGNPPRVAEVAVGRIPYYGSISDLDHILAKIIAYESSPEVANSWRKNALLPMNPSDNVTPGYQLGEKIKNDILIPHDWSYHRVYDQYNTYCEPGSPGYVIGIPADTETIPCNVTNVTNAWNGSAFGAVFWWAHGSQVYAEDIMDLSHAATLDDSHPGFTFQCSCLNGYPEAANNLGYTLLKNGCIATVSASRVSWYEPKQTSFTGTATNSGMTYEYAKRLITEGMHAGDALNGLRADISPGFEELWMNYIDFNLYGCPAVGLYTCREESVVYDSHQINDASGNGDGLADSGENILLGVTLKNISGSTADNVSAVLSLMEPDPYITITDNAQFWGTIGAGATSTQSDAFAFTVAGNVPDQHLVQFKVEATGTHPRVPPWLSEFSITVNAPELGAGALTIDDSSGNGNGLLDAGETANIFVQTSNLGHVAAPSTTCTLSCVNPWLTINTSVCNLGTVNAGATAAASFNVTVSASAPRGEVVDFQYNVASGLYSASQTFRRWVGMTNQQLGSGSTSFDYPFKTSSMDSRTQSVLLAGDIHHSGSIRLVSLYCSSRPGKNLSNFYIRMQHTSLDSFTSTSFVNENWTTVLHATNVDVSEWAVPGWVTFELTTPFEYDGIRNLLIDYCIDNSSAAAPDGLCYSTLAVNRTLVSYATLASGNLLNCSEGLQTDRYNNVTLTGVLTWMPPDITSVSPNQGIQGQSRSVTINGSYFIGATSVGFGPGITVYGFTVNSATQITASISISNVAAPGARDVSVTTPGGMAAAKDGFTVDPAPPSITHVIPNQGIQGQRLNVSISGFYFTGATSVSFGPEIAVESFNVEDAYQIKAVIAISDSATLGARTVLVTTPGGTITKENAFTVNQSPPTIASVSPSHGVQGQTLNVAITGTRFTGTASISFGPGITIKNFTVSSPTQVTATIDIGCEAAAGPRDFSVTTPGGTTTLPGGFIVSALLPSRPRNLSPASGAVVMTLTPTLTSSAFSHPCQGRTHAASQWQVTAVARDYSNPILDTGTDAGNLTSISLPWGVLDEQEVYYWRVRYQDNRGSWSDWSVETSFSRPDFIRAGLSGPAEIRVHDQLDRVTGSVDGQAREGIANSDYFNNSVTVVPPSDTYSYEVVGTEDGFYSLTVSRVVGDETLVFHAAEIPVSAGEKHQYVIDWEALSRGKNGVEIKIDSDGDGKFDKTAFVGNELDGGKFLSAANGGSTPLWVWICVGFGALLVSGLSTLLLIARRRARADVLP